MFTLAVPEMHIQHGSSGRRGSISRTALGTRDASPSRRGAPAAVVPSLSSPEPRSLPRPRASSRRRTRSQLQSVASAVSRARVLVSRVDDPDPDPLTSRVPPASLSDRTLSVEPLGGKDGGSPSPTTKYVTHRSLSFLLPRSLRPFSLSFTHSVTSSSLSRFSSRPLLERTQATPYLASSVPSSRMEQRALGGPRDAQRGNGIAVQRDSRTVT